MTHLREHAELILQTALSAVDPSHLINRAVRLDGDELTVGPGTYRLSSYEKILVIGAGKASSQMAVALETVLGGRIAGGLVITKYGHAAPCAFVEVAEAGHPVTDQNSIEATRLLLGLARGAGERDLVFCLLSGGGSALLELPPPDLSLQDLQEINQALLRSGASIEEINTVRRHLSEVKGGRLARALAPATCVSLILSDVIGDPLPAIASGPTAPDSSSYEDALGVVRRFGLEVTLPGAALRHLRAGADGLIPETARPDEQAFARVRNIIIGSSRVALEAAEAKARSLGYSTLVVTTQLNGEAREAGRRVAGMVQGVRSSGTPLPPPACLLLGGETTVTVKGEGTGGRNQELALAALAAMAGTEGEYLIASCGTDGSDGPTDAAGAIATPEALHRALKAGLQPGEYLARNDSYPFWKTTGGLLVTGPTGTNVMDIVIALVPA